MHIAADALGNPRRVLLSAGQEADISHAPVLRNGLEAEVLVGDKGYDSDEFVASVQADETVVVIPPRKNRKTPRDYDRHLYKVRHLVECLIGRLKQYRRLGTRYEKSAQNFLAFWQFGCLMDWLR